LLARSRLSPEARSAKVAIVRAELVDAADTIVLLRAGVRLPIG
jgi:hypothetical protein